MFQAYTYKGEPVKDIWQWVKDHKDVMMRLHWKKYEPLTSSWSYYQTVVPKSWFDCMRISGPDILVKSEEVSYEEFFGKKEVGGEHRA